MKGKENGMGKCNGIIVFFTILRTGIQWWKSEHCIVTHSDSDGTILNALEYLSEK